MTERGAVAEARAGEVANGDVVDMLIAQHGLIRDLFAEVKSTEGKSREEAFHRLRHLLAVHETAEEELVHPTARRALDGGNEGLVDDRLAEENEAKQALSRLEELPAGDPQFLELLDELRIAVLAHARSEERYEFMKLREKLDPATLKGMAASVKAAEAVAPTHPHPGVESTAANLAAGPFAAVVDRVKDAIRGTTATIDDPRS
jgi:hemerythrin superfamily protein